MQENTKFTLDYFDKNLRNLSGFAFDIDRESRVILGIIAKNGPVTETKITSLGKRRIILSRDIIRRRIVDTDLSSDFLSTKKGKKIGNLKGKQEKFYSLTFKGFLASLFEIPIQENFWIKNYIKMIKNITSDITAKEFLNHIYFSVAAFLILHCNKRGMLTTFKEPEEEFFNNYGFEGALPQILEKTHVKGIPEEYEKLFIYCVVQFFVSCEVIGNLLDITLQKKSFPKSLVKNWNNRHYGIKEEIIHNLFRSWMWTMFMTHNKTLKEILKECEKVGDYEDDEGLSFADELGDEKWDSIFFMTADKLNKIKPELNIQRTKFVNKSRIGNGHSLYTE